LPVAVGVLAFGALAAVILPGKRAFEASRIAREKELVLV
jgi:hypothetical protein